MISSSTIEAIPDDEDLYQRDLQAVRQLIVSFATQKVGYEAAEDIAQEAVLILMQKYSEVRKREDMIRLAVGITRNKCFERFRKVARETEFSDTTPDDSDIHRELERRQVIDRILPAILQLGERCRAVLRLMLFEEKGAAAVQAALKAKSINTVYTWEHRCFKQLVELISGKVYAPSTG